MYGFVRISAGGWKDLRVGEKANSPTVTAGQLASGVPKGVGEWFSFRSRSKMVPEI